MKHQINVSKRAAIQLSFHSIMMNNWKICSLLRRRWDIGYADCKPHVLYSLLAKMNTHENLNKIVRKKCHWQFTKCFRCEKLSTASDFGVENGLSCFIFSFLFLYKISLWIIDETHSFVSFSKKFFFFLNSRIIFLFSMFAIP